MNKISFQDRENVRKLLPQTPPRLLSLEQFENSAADLMGQMLIINPNKRICVQKSLAHPYLQSYRNAGNEVRKKFIFYMRLMKLLGVLF